MNRRRCSATLVLGLMLTGGSLGTGRLEAAKKGGEDGQVAKCQYLLSIIEYPYVSPTIKAWAISLYNAEGCNAILP
jgi:hypothetical protein